MSAQPFPTLEQLQDELTRTRSLRRSGHALRVSLFIVLVILLLALLAASLLFSVIRIQGSAMSPTLQHGDVVIAFKWANIEKGDLASFYYNQNLLVKRVIAEGGDVVDISPDGMVSVNGKILSEDYICASAQESCDVSFPYTVSTERYFMLGDERSISLDSRHKAVGCIAPEQIAGRVFLRIWPLDQINFFP